MRAYWKTLVAVAAILVVVPQLAAADEVQDQLNQMQERMAQLEDSLKATQDELVSAQGQVEEQQNVIRRSGLDEERSGFSALSAFLNDTEFGGAVAASYNYNFNDPANGVNGGITTHGTNNSFQVDQVHFSMSNDSTEKSRAGFGFDTIQGATAANGDSPQIMQAYASYLMPVGNGVTLTAGRFDSDIGAETEYVGENLNITRGLVRALQPINHNGAKLGMALNDSLNLSASVSNTGFLGSTTNADGNDAKTWTVGADWSSDNAGLGVTYMAFDDSIGTDRGHMVDVVASWDPSDNLTVWANLDWAKNGGPGVGADGDSVIGFALASRLGISDTTGVGVRGEVTSTDAVAGDVTAYSLTLTGDHALTDNLTARAEYRYDSNDNNIFADDTGAAATDSQHLVVGQLVYSF